jgi:hypothetical protein
MAILYAKDSFSSHDACHQLLTYLASETFSNCNCWLLAEVPLVFLNGLDDE